MNIKSTISVLAFMLLWAMQLALTMGDGDHTELHKLVDRTKKPAEAPVDAPVPDPPAARLHTLSNMKLFVSFEPFPHDSSTIAQVQPIAKAMTSLVNLQALDPNNGGGCPQTCLAYCKTKTPKRLCQRACSDCCKEYKCVPAGLKKCPKWSEVKYHGRIVKCP